MNLRLSNAICPIVLLLAGLVVSACGCSSEPQVIVPDEETANLYDQANEAAEKAAAEANGPATFDKE